MRHRLAIFVAAFAVSCSHGPIPAPALAPPALDEGALVARGEAIVRNIAVCGGCHSADPKNPDGPLSGGREFRDWRIGVARAANLTSDRATGLGDWTDGEIARAIRNGVSRNGRLLAPVMPYEWFHEMSDQDALAVARYLRTLPPVHNSVAQSPNLIFKAGKALFLHPRPAMTVPMPAGGAAPEYGAYLTQHVGLCAECHTPKSGLLNRPDRSRLFAGTADPPKDFPANPSNITPDLKDKFSLSDDKGVVVVGVSKDSPASEKGLKAGDVIMEAAQEEIKNAGQVLGKIADAKKAGRKSILLLVERQGDLRFVALRLDHG